MNGGLDLSNLGKGLPAAPKPCPAHSLIPMIFKQVTDENEDILLLVMKAWCPHCGQEVNFKAEAPQEK